MRVIGTAGHVDHGKSTLIEAISGMHPDRLQEEREREMTIVLGFAWLTLPDGEEIGIVDVPGHRDFIENMLSGIGGIDAALFVVAADEGVMPQTREHLAILDLLQIQGGVVALTKVDMVHDPEWLDLVEMDVRDALAGTVLENAPIVPVSARNRLGLETLLTTLQSELADRPARPDLGRPRLAVDRVFTIAGFGTIVTGTLTDGHLSVGDEVTLLPQNLRGRVRGLQTHKKKEETAWPGSRTAVNISGISVDQLKRGDVVTHPGDYRATRRIDVQFRQLADVSQPLRHNTEVKLFVGASEVLARLRLLGQDVLQPGETGWLQLELREPVVVIRGDRYVLRRPSPGETLGGGAIVDPRPKGRHKRFDKKVLSGLQAMAEGSPADIFQQALLALGAASYQEVVTRSTLEADLAQQALDELLAAGQALILDGNQDQIRTDTLLASLAYWEHLRQKVVSAVSAYHQKYPLRFGMPREELKSRLKIPVRIYNLLLERMQADGDLVERSVRPQTPGASSVPLLSEPGHSIHLTPEQQARVDRLLALFERQPYAPPSVKESIAEVGDDVYAALLDLGQLLQVSDEVVFRTQDFERIVAQIREILMRAGTISVAQVRDHFNTSRRYVLALLEYLDAVGLTIRDGDVRKFNPKAR